MVFISGQPYQEKCNRRSFVPGKCIIHYKFPHKTQFYVILLKSIKNADSYHFIVKKQVKILVYGQNIRKGGTTLKTFAVLEIIRMIEV